VGGFVAVKLAAFDAFVNYNITFFCIKLYFYGFHLTLAKAGSVTGIYIEVERPQAKRAVISRCIPERFDFFATMRAYKAVIVF